MYATPTSTITPRSSICVYIPSRVVVTASSYIFMRLVIISYKSIIRFGKVLTKKLTTQHQKRCSLLSRSAKSLSVTTTIQKLSSSRRSVVDKKVFSKTPATTSPVAAILRTARVVRAESGDGVVTVAEPKENGSTDDDVARGVADASRRREKRSKWMTRRRRTTSRRPRCNKEQKPRCEWCLFFSLLLSAFLWTDDVGINPIAFSGDVRRCCPMWPSLKVWFSTKDFLLSNVVLSSSLTFFLFFFFLSSLLR